MMPSLAVRSLSVHRRFWRRKQNDVRISIRCCLAITAMMVLISHGRRVQNIKLLKGTFIHISVQDISIIPYGYDCNLDGSYLIEGEDEFWLWLKKKARFSPRPWPVCLRTRLSILMNWNRESDSFIASFMLLKAVFPEQWKSERRWFQKVSRSRPQDQRSNLVSIFKSRKMSLDSKLYQRGYVCWLASPVKFCWWIVWLC